jgi:hypothetical protein
MLRWSQKKMQELDSEFEWEGLYDTLVSEFNNCRGYRAEKTDAADNDNDDDGDDKGTKKKATRARKSKRDADADDNDVDKNRDADADEPSNDQFASLRALAQRFAVSYGIPMCRDPKLLKNLAMIISHGLAWCAQPLLAAADDADAGAEAAAREGVARLPFATFALEPFVARLNAPTAAKLLNVAEDVAKRAHISSSDDAHTPIVSLIAALKVCCLCAC